MSLKINDQQVNSLIKTLNIYGSLFINSASEVKLEKEREDGKVSREYYVLSCLSLEDMSVSGTRCAFQTHNGDGTTAQWKSELSPALAHAFQRRMETTGEIMEITGYKIAKIEYNRPYVVNGRDVYKDTVVFACNDEAGTSSLETVLRNRLQDHGLLERVPASPVAA